MQSTIDARTTSATKAASDAADKQTKEIKDYISGVATDVKAGHITREAAQDQINKKYPGYGGTIYDEVPDNYVIKPTESSSLQHVSKTVSDILGSHTVTGTFNPATGEYKWDE
jgi:cell division protein FtsX